MADELTIDVAMDLARSLKTIDGFPWDASTAQATAEDLIRWCRGAFVGSTMWPAEAQARWLVTHARENWEKWQGTSELRALLRSKFEPKAKAGNEVIDYGSSPCICGSGQMFRRCCQGKPLPAMDFGTVKTLGPVRVPRKKVG